MGCATAEPTSGQAVRIWKFAGGWVKDIGVGCVGPFLLSSFETHEKAAGNRMAMMRQYLVRLLDAAI